MNQIQKPAGIVIAAYDAMNLGFALSNISEGYTEEELRSGQEILTADQLLETWVPESPESVAIRITLSLGWINKDTSDCFGLYVVTNSLRDIWESEQKSRSASNRITTIYCGYYDWPTIKSRIDRMLYECERPTAKESWLELKKRFEWEYENMPGS